MTCSRFPGRVPLGVLVSVCIAAVPAGTARGQEYKQGRVFRVFGADDRRPVADTTVPPWSSIGMIVAHWGTAGDHQIRVGTGTLISDRVVLSCGHVVFDAGIGWAERIVFVPGQNAVDEPFGSFVATTAITTDEWASRQSNEHDLSMLLLNKPAGQQAGRMRVAGLPPSFFVNQTLNMSGYPSDLVWNQLHNAAGQSQRIEGNLIHHLIDGAQGQSGGPLWFTDPATGEAALVGVYTGDVDVTLNGQLVDTYGYGIQMNATLCAWVSSRANQLDAGAAISCETAQDAARLPAAPACGGGLGAAVPMTAAWLWIARFRRTAGRAPDLRARRTGCG